jgi:CheY-like chemotaxis protein
MDAEAMAHVFEPFYTTKTGRGTGLGLATVFGIVRQNDGTIRVESAADRGTTFTIHLPRATGVPASLAATLGPKSVGAGRETVLLVEDEAAILSLGRTILERLGYTVFTAATPEEAERIAGEHGAAIDLLLTDVVMPQMNGRMLAERITAAHPRMKTLFMSGYPTDIITHSGGLETGVHFLQKPFTPRALGAAVRERLEDPKS